ncbi:MAG TPA: RDD family protein [Pseudomonadota bacterium]|nr:RDD family protein [Pseudomonadota bacterium]
MGLVATSALEPSIESVLEPSILVRAAGMIRRTLAFVVDLGFLLPLQVLFFCGLRLGQRLPLPRLKELYPDVLLANLSDGSLSSQALCISFVAVSVAYFVFFWTLRGQTPGKWLLRIAVVDVYGERPSLLRSLCRATGLVVAVLPCALGVLWIGFDREKRGLHDFLSGTYVVHVP